MDKRRKGWLRRVGLPLLVLAGVIGLVAAAVVIWWEPVFAQFMDREQLRETIQGTGVFGPLVFILAQIAQTIIAPIPGQVLGIAGGALFGWMGLIWGLIGSIVGALIVFLLMRKYGRPLAEKLISKKNLKKFDFLIERRGVAAIFIVFLLPIFPDSVMCYIAGLTKVPIKTLLVLWIAGRVPTAVINNMIGEGMSKAMIRPIIVMILICVVMGVVLYAKRAQISALMASESYVEYLKKNWPYKLLHTIVVGVLCLLVCVAAVYLSMQDFGD